MPPLPHASAYLRRVTASEVGAAFGPFDELTPIGERSGSGECWVGRTGTEHEVVKIVVYEHEPGRFAREVKALARLDSPRVMRVHDHGELPTAEGTFPYLRSEFVPGGNLREHLGADGTVLPDDTIRVFLLELLRGLADLAEASIVHRDLKPENIILRDNAWSCPIIIDLGLSRLVDTTSVTVYPWALGTWQYMAPEQIRAERATGLSDVWAAAIVSAEVAAGAHPFFRGEASIPHDWDARLRAGPAVSDSRPAALRDWTAAGAHYRAYKRPSAAKSVQQLEESW